MMEYNYEILKYISNVLRKKVIETVYKCQAGHLGGPLSCMDILISLYSHIMKIDLDNPENPYRDRFVLSKGHSAISLYTVLASLGYLSFDELLTFDKINSRLQAHPDMNLLPGIDFSTGSLGQGISAAVGMALGAKLQGMDFKTYCLIGDGESQEGQVWEAIDFAVKYCLDNLIIIMDYNKLQQFGFGMTYPINNPHYKFAAFGCNVIQINGHNHKEIIEACESIIEGKPTFIIAHTIKGKGVSFMEGKKEYHSKILTDEEYKKAMDELNE